KGASERDLVISGLEDIVVSTYHSMNETRHQKQLTRLRPAAFILALERISISYLDLGIFPCYANELCRYIIKQGLLREESLLPPSFLTTSLTADVIGYYL